MREKICPACVILLQQLHWTIKNNLLPADRGSENFKQLQISYFLWSKEFCTTKQTCIAAPARDRDKIMQYLSPLIHYWLNMIVIPPTTRTLFSSADAQKPVCVKIWGFAYQYLFVQVFVLNIFTVEGFQAKIVQIFALFADSVCLVSIAIIRKCVNSFRRQK